MSAANSQSFTFSRGGSWQGTLILFAAALPLFAIGMLPLLLIERGPILEAWQSLAIVGGVIALLLGGIALLFAGISLVTGLLFGHEVTLDAAGAHKQDFFGGIQSVGWDEGLQVRLTERTQSITKSEAPFIPLKGVNGIVGLLHEMTAERETQVIRGVRIESPRFKLQDEPDPLTMIRLVRWLMCRALERVIVEQGGSVAWEDDGFASVHLADLPITDEVFAPLGEQLAKLPQLTHLNVNHTRLTNASLPLLKTFRNLRRIEADGTHLDASAVRAIMLAFESKTSSFGPTNFDFS